MKHVPFGARARPPVQGAVPATRAKSEALGPVIVTGVPAPSCSGEPPVLVTATVCEALVVLTGCDGKVRVDGETPAFCKAAVPVPVRETVCVAPAVPPELSVMVRVAVRVPVAVGVKVTLIVQVPGFGIDAPFVQVVPVAMAKSPALVPLMVTAAVAANTRFAPPLFATDTNCAALVVLTVCLAN